MYKPVLVLLFVAQIFSTIAYLIEFKDGFNKKTLAIKTLCSSLFVITGCVAGLSNGNFQSPYVKCVVFGLILSLAGDVLLHDAHTMPRYITGGLCFLTAHVLYITAYIKTASETFGENSFITIKELIVMAVIYVIGAGLYLGFRLKAGKLLVPIMIYALVLSFMMAKAAGLGMLQMQFASSPTGGLTLCFGAFLFVISDFMLGISFLGETTYQKRVLNMATYFPAQMLLALSICYIA